MTLNKDYLLDIKINFDQTGQLPATQLPVKKDAEISESRDICYDLLVKVSRSFAKAITLLGPELRDAVCMFYLVLRALDTIEDDMSLDKKKKVQWLSDFHTTIFKYGWNFHESKEKDSIVLEQFHHVIDQFLRLDKRFQIVIKEITRRMGIGMAQYIAGERKTLTCDDYDLYCHYVAGLVGIGLSHLFVASSLEDVSLIENTRISNSMGLFLQKTNIIRDFLEDFRDNRIFWPREIWGTYVDNLEHFTEKQYRAKAVDCLNHMIADALECIPDCVQYLTMIKDRRTLEFCALPQLMAIATLAECYDNGLVFEKNVKISRTLTLQLVQYSGKANNVKRQFLRFLDAVARKAQRGSEADFRTQSAIGKAKVSCYDSNVVFEATLWRQIYIYPLIAIIMTLAVMQLMKKK